MLQLQGAKGVAVEKNEQRRQNKTILPHTIRDSQRQREQNQKRTTRL